MTLKSRVIPCLDVKDGRVVKGVNFVDLVDAGDPVEAAKAYDAAGADELCFLDITASSDNRETIFDVVARTAEQCFMPLTVGGGVRTVGRYPQAAAGRRRQGVDQHGGGEEPGFRRRRPPTSSATSASSSRSTPRRSSARRRVRSLGDLHPWRPPARPASTPSRLRAKVVERGAGEILLTSMDRDGTKAGYDIALTRAIADAVRVPVIASGGVGTLDHLVEGIRDGHATAVLAASIFHFGTYSIRAGQAAYGESRARRAARLRDRLTLNGRA